MPSLKTIRKRITSVKSTQKITRAMKMVAAARLRRAQQRITEMRPFAVKTAEVLSNIAMHVGPVGEEIHPLLVRRDEKSVLLVVISSDRGLAGAFNANVNRMAERTKRAMEQDGKRVVLVTIGRKARDYFRRRGAEILAELPGVSEKINIGRADEVADQLIDLYAPQTPDSIVESEADRAPAEPFDSVYLIYNEFKSAMTQRPVMHRLLPIDPTTDENDDSLEPRASHVPPGAMGLDFIYEPNRKALLDRLLPLYVQISVFRGLLESVASEHGARMTAMDAATGNAKDMISKLTLLYNRARQAAITKELMEIIGGAEALK